MLNKHQKILFFGDFWPVNYFSLPSFISDDAYVVVNLETALHDGTYRVTKAYSVDIEESQFKNILSINPAAVNLANNHVFDCGKKGFEKLVSLLSDRSIDVFGLASKPHSSFWINGLHCAVVGCQEASRNRQKELFPEEKVLSHVKNIRHKYDKIYVTPHWGKEGEYTHYPSPGQRKLAERWIDEGVDGVFGHHSHVFQGMEKIQEKPVYYSLGNFFFPHEEGAMYPMARYGLGVNVIPSASRETDHFFIEHNSETVWKIIENDHVAGLEQVFLNSCKEIENLTFRRWAKLISSVYISKSDKSWKIRFKKSFWKTLPRWVVWNLLPKTVWLRSMKFLSNL
jgi:hypothetical protein